MTGTYDAPLVTLSVAIAIFASYVALDLASRVLASVNSSSARYWLAGGALSMGTGIWSMHFIGMLAFSLPIPMAYNIPVTLLSLLIAVVSSGFALRVVGSAALSTRKLLVAGTLMGMGIAAMHYTGMAAMEVAPPIRYDEALFALSVAIAAAASIAALWIAFRLRAETVFSAFWKKAGSAVVMGAAIVTMHYTGMAAAHFAPDSVCLVDPRNVSNGWLAASVGGFTFLLLTTTLLVSVFDARLADRSARLAATLRKANADLEKHAAELTQAQQALRVSEQRYRVLWETSNEAILLINDAGRIQYANPAVREIFGHDPAALEGKHIEILQPSRLRAAHHAAFERYLKTGIKTLNWRSLEVWGLHSNGREFPIEIAFSRLEFDGEAGFAGFIKDITDRKHFESMLLGQKQVLETISSNASLSETLHIITRMVEERTPGWLCSILLADPGGKHLQCAAVASLPAEYNAAINGGAIGPEAGSCGTAAYRRELVVVEDIATDPLWAPPYRDLALRHGLRACWSHPVISPSGRLLGTFAVYNREPRRPQPNDIDAIRTTAALASIAIERKQAEEHAQRMSERFQLVAKATNDVVWDWDFATNTLWWNEGFEHLFGYRLQEVEPGPEAWYNRIHPEDHERVIAGIRAAIDAVNVSTWKDEYRFRRGDGTYADVLDRGYMMRDASGKALRMLGAMMDITARKQAEDRMQRLNRVYAVLSGINALIVRSRDRQELLDGACRIAAEHGGFGIVTISLWSAETSTLVPAAWAGPDIARFMEIVSTSGVPLEQLGPLGDALRQGKPMFVNDIGAELQRGIGGARRKAAFSLGYQSAIALPLMVAKKVAGRISIYAKEKNFFNAEEIKLLVELADDISFAMEHITNEERLNYLAYYDALTGLPNRALFHERLSHQLHVAAQQGLKVVLLLGDVKRFRLINESLGRQSGDALLKEIAARFKHTWPDPDNLARITADLFAGILFNIKELHEISALLDKTASTVTGPTFQLGDRELSIAMTAGIAVFPEDGSDGEQLFNNAEAALKQAKARGETFLFYRPAMNAAVSETLLLESKLRRALEKAQFVLHYQPKINLASRRISGLEALIRWNDPDSGLVSPDKFIPLLEETGMINEIGLWAMRQSLADHSDWRRRGLQVPRIAVNVSAVQLARRDFVDIVRKTLDKAGAGAHELDLEITESLLMQDVEGNIAKLHALRDMGLKIAIDDFGTGYSSLGYLARLPVNALKIDRSFIITMTRDSDSMSIVSTIISLAHSLNLLVIAEGVDSEEQRKILQLLRCDEIQGYLISKPVPAEDVAHLLREDGNRA